MSRDSGVVRGILLVVLAAAPSGLAACGSGSSNAAETRQRTTTVAKPANAAKSVTIRVTSVVAARRAQDTPPKGVSSGDKVISSDRLFNAVAQFGKEVNAQVGVDRATMTFTGPHSARLEGEATLPDGTIQFSGAMTVHPDNSITVPIVGGTGKYKDATGTLVVGAGDARARNTYRLLIGGVPGPVA